MAAKTLELVMSLPRCGMNDSWACVVDTARCLGIPLRRYGGVFWGQAMQHGLESALARNVDWVLTADYDSVFTVADVRRLIALFAQSTDFTAVAALQCRRGCTEPLFHRRIAESVKPEIQVVPVTTAHFGLTMIRMDDLRALPKPWFMPTPDEHGGWDEGHIDEDIHFWLQLEKAGRKVGIAPSVSIGHLELMVTRFNAEGKVEQVRVHEYARSEERVCPTH